MQYVSATEAKQAFAATLDKAQREPVVIQRQNRDVAVLLSTQDYERMRRLNIEEFQQFRSAMGRAVQERGLTESKLNAILAEPE